MHAYASLLKMNILQVFEPDEFFLDYLLYRWSQCEYVAII